MVDTVEVVPVGGKAYTRPMTPEELAQRAADQAAEAALPKPKRPSDYQAEWASLNADLAALADQWAAATSAERQTLLRQALVAVNRKVTILGHALARGVLVPEENQP